MMQRKKFLGIWLLVWTVVFILGMVLPGIGFAVATVLLGLVVAGFILKSRFFGQGDSDARGSSASPAEREASREDGFLPGSTPAAPVSPGSRITPEHEAAAEELKAYRVLLEEVLKDLESLAISESQDPRSAQAPEEFLVQTEEDLEPRIKRLQTDTKAVLGNVSQAYSISDNLSKTAKDAFALAEKVQKGIENINHILRQSLENTNFLEEQSKKISRILDLMGEVSSQIHVLSINASIVSARAGTHGRGFEVVAKEIRELSHQTESSLQDIADSIEEIQQTIRKVGEDTHQADQAAAEETKSLISVAGSLQGVQLAIEVVHTVSTGSKEKIQQQIDDLAQIESLHQGLRGSLDQLLPALSASRQEGRVLAGVIARIREAIQNKS